MLTRRPRLIALAFAAATVTSLAAPAVGHAVGTQTTPVAAPDLDTPEAAVEAFLSGVAANDLDAVLAASAVDERAAGYDFVASIIRIRSFNPVINVQVPVDGEFSIEINRTKYAGMVAQSVQLLGWSLLADVPIEPITTPVEDEAWPAEFAASVDLAGLAELAVIEVAAPTPSITESDRHIENLAVMAALVGADEQVDRVAFVDLDGETFVVPFTLLRYGSTWKVADLNSAITGLSILPVAHPATAQDFDDLTSG